MPVRIAESWFNEGIDDIESEERSLVSAWTWGRVGSDGGLSAATNFSRGRACGYPCESAEGEDGWPCVDWRRGERDEEVAVGVCAARVTLLRNEPIPPKEDVLDLGRGRAEPGCCSRGGINIRLELNQQSPPFNNKLTSITNILSLTIFTTLLNTFRASQETCYSTTPKRTAQMQIHS